MNETNPNQNTPQVPNLLFSSLLQAQTHLANPKKDTTGYGYKYAQLDQIIEIVKPVLAEYGLGIIQSPHGPIVDGCLTLKTIIFHESGQHLIEQFAIPLKEGTNVTQDYGSALTYARRYHLLSLFNLAAEDDDGAGSKQKAPAAPRKNKPAANAQKNPVRDPKLVDAADARLGDLAITDWAEATGFIPHKTKEETLKRFLSLSDDEIFVKVEEWRKKAA
jgi:hypothetical protein